MCEWGAVMLSPGPHFIIPQVFLNIHSQAKAYSGHFVFSSLAEELWAERGLSELSFWKEKVLRGSAWEQGYIQDFLPQGILRTPHCYTHIHTLATNRVALSYCSRLSNTQQPQLCSLPTNIQSDQGLGLPISWKRGKYHSLVSASLMCRERLLCQR